MEEFRARFEELIVVSEQHAQLLESLLVLATSERGLDRRGASTCPNWPTTCCEPPSRKHDNRTWPSRRRSGPRGVTGDPALVARLVANLVDNAMSHNVPDGRVEVATGTDGGRAFLVVANTGPPVPPEVVDLLLSPFERLDRTAADDGHHGLGLSIVASIAVAHSADLTLRARPTGGLAIKVLFPAE